MVRFLRHLRNYTDSIPWADLSQVKNIVGRSAMDQEYFHRNYHEALSKAFAARASNVRAAYFDLAAYYYENMGNRAQTFPSNEDLQRCLATRDRPTRHILG